jgi:uncharacterized protein (UPF0248 family)
LRELLNWLRWDSGAGPERVVLEVRVREGGEERVQEVRFEDILKILPAGVTVADGTFLPYHRVAAVRRGLEVVWRSSRG